VIFAVEFVHSTVGPRNGGNNAVFKPGAAVENSVHIQTGMSQTNMKSAAGEACKYWLEARKLFDYRYLESYSQFA
jgi:hypothetical protein